MLVGAIGYKSQEFSEGLRDYLDDEQKVDECLSHLKASVDAEKALTIEVSEDVRKHEAHSSMIAALLVSEEVFISTNWYREDWPDVAKTQAVLAVMCNDVFAWGVADAEQLDFKEIDDLYSHWDYDPVWGTAIWCVKKRKMMPQKPVCEKITEAGKWDLSEIQKAIKA